MELQPQEFSVTNAGLVQKFVDYYIGVESEILDSDNDNITVYDLLPKDLEKIREFITNKKLWRE